MGQFYKGTAAEFLDNKMFQLPFEQMKDIIEKKDKEAETGIEQANALSELLKAQTLDADKARANQIISGYTKGIDDITNQIISDPLNAALYNPKIKNLSRSIKENWERGEIGAMQGNFATYQEWEKDLAEKMKKDSKLYSPDQADALKKAKLAEFNAKGGTKFESPTKYQAFDTEEIAGLTPFQEFTEQLMKGAVQDVNATVSWDEDRGEYRVSGKTGNKWFSEQQLEQMYKTALATDPNIATGIKQREALGLEGFDTTNFDEEGRPVFSSNNYLGQGLQNLKAKYGGHETVRESGKLYNKLWERNQDKADKLAETEYTHEVVTAMDKTYAGNSMEQQAAVAKAADQNVKTAVNKGLGHVAEQLGFKDFNKFKSQHPELAGQIENGDFSSVVDPTIRKQLSAQYKQGKLITNYNDALEAEFNRTYGHQNWNVGKLKGGKYDERSSKMVKTAWDNFLKSRAIVPKDADTSFEGTGVDQKKMNQITKDFYDMGFHYKAPMGLPNGTKIGNVIIGQSFTDTKTNKVLPFTVNEKGQYVITNASLPYFDKDKNGKYTIKPEVKKTMKLINDVSADDLVKMNVIRPKSQKKVTGRDELGEESYEIVNGGGYLNFDKNKLIKPRLSLNDDDNMDVYYGVNIGGQNYQARTDKFSSTSLNEFKDVNRDIMKVQQYLNKLGGAENVSLKGVVNDGSDMIYHGADSSVKGKDGKPTYRAGEITLTLRNKDGSSKRVTRSANDPEVLKLLTDGFKTD